MPSMFKSLKRMTSLKKTVSTASTPADTYLNAQEPTKLTNKTSNNTSTNTSFTKNSSSSTNDSTNLTSSISSSELSLSNTISNSISNSSSKNSSLARSPRTSKKRFGSKKRTDSSCNDQATQNAVTQLRHAIDNLEQRQDKLEKQITRADVRAREYKTANNKQAAIQSLKKKKALEQQLQQLDNQITNMEGKLGVLEAAQTNLLVYRNSVTAGESLRRIHKQVNVTEVEDAVFEFEQQTVLADDLGKAIGSFRQVDSGNYDEEEEEDLMAELEALEMEECSPSSIMPTSRRGSVEPAYRAIYFPEVPSCPPKPSRNTLIRKQDSMAGLTSKDGSRQAVFDF